MFATAYHQLRYAAGLLRGRSVPVDSLGRLARDLVATVAEFGAPGEDSQLIPGQQGGPDPAARLAITTRSLRLTARRAVTRTAYYRDLRIRPAELSVESWTQLPVTPKQALRDTPGAFVADGVPPALLALTTGTSGTPTRVAYSQRELDMLAALNTISAVLAQGLRPGHVVAYAGSSRATVPMMCTSAGTRGAGATLVQFGIVEPSIALERLVTPLGLRGAAPLVTHLTANTSYLAALVAAGEQSGRRPEDFGLVAIQVGGEILTDALRARAREVFGVPIGIGYALTEALPFGATRCSAGHLHHAAEFGHMEVLDPATYQPVGPGQTGTLTITPYVPYRECTLLLRYVTGDLVRQLPGEPACELAAIPATSDVLGRYTGPLSLRIPRREVMEVLDAERGVPQPARFALVDDPAGPLLHVLVRQAQPALRSRLEQGVADRSLNLAGIVLHEDIEDLPPYPPPRSDLRERSFELESPVPVTAGRP
jgi:phenylacetate-CoA ligase